jgi:response regulator RpfG family c-di-GMP phosphodiesterase
MGGTGSANIVVVDDDELTRCYLESVLLPEGYRCSLFPGGKDVLSYLATAAHDVSLILSDIDMPGMNGVELLQAVKRVAPEIPFILISGHYERSEATEALRLGASDYLLKTSQPTDIVTLLEKHLRKPGGLPQQAVRSALVRFLNKLKLSGGDTATHLVPLFDVLCIRRFETLQHSQRVAAYSRLVGAVHGLGEQALEELEIGALLHDIGKAAIPHNILMKPGSLTESEWKVMRCHTLIGAELLAAVPGIGGEADIVRFHHEKVDGTGYPLGLVKDQIPIGARVFAVADALDAICSDRPYRMGASLAEARREIEQCSGTHFDPDVVVSFRGVADAQLDEVRERFPDQAGDLPEAGEKQTTADLAHLATGTANTAPLPVRSGKA